MKDLILGAITALCIVGCMATVTYDSKKDETVIKCLGVCSSLDYKVDVKNKHEWLGWEDDNTRRCFCDIYIYIPRESTGIYKEQLLDHIIW